MEDNWATWDEAPAEAEAEAENWAAFEEPTASDQPQQPPEAAAPVSTEGLKTATVNYNFEAQNSDELTINENEVVYISTEECDEEGWVVAINSEGQKGYVPLNYLVLTEEPLATNDYADQFDPVSQQSAPWETNYATSEHSAPKVTQPLPWQASFPEQAQPPAWQASFAEEDNSSEDEDDSEATDTMPPPPDMPPPIPDCPPPLYEFSKSHSISIDGSLSTFSTDYCLGMYDYEATGTDEISFKVSDCTCFSSFSFTLVFLLTSVRAASKW